MALVVTALSTPLATAMAQTGRRFWVVMAAGAGYAVADTVHQPAAGYTVRLGVGLPVLRRAGIEASLLKEGVISRAADACVGGVPCPVDFGLLGGGAGVVAGVGPSDDQSLFRLSFGAGGYRVGAESTPTRSVPAVTALGWHAGFEGIIDRWDRGDLSMGVRGLLIPDANGERLWLVAFELAMRLR